MLLLRHRLKVSGEKFPLWHFSSISTVGMPEPTSREGLGKMGAGSGDDRKWFALEFWEDRHKTEA